MKKTILSTVDVARLFNVTETTVKRWADGGTLQCHKTPGGHRRFPVRHVVEFAERNKFDPLGVLALPEDDGNSEYVQMAMVKRDFNALVKIFEDKALHPSRANLYVFFSYLYEHRIPLWEIYDKVLRPGMTMIGERWERGEISVNQEHRASYATLDALARLQSKIHVKSSNGHAAVFACAEEELHEIGLRAIAYLLESEGWDTHYLGARTPVAAALAAVKDVNASVLALSMTYASEPARCVANLRQIVAAAPSLGVRVIIGGIGVPQEAREIPGLDASLSSAEELMACLGQMLPAVAGATKGIR